MHYTVYKITNLLNNKTYIGKHQTNNLDDGYLGSGKYIQSAISKYGKENFIKEILHSYDNEEDMNSKERELVKIGPDSYNLCEGGAGGFNYINKNGFGIRKGPMTEDTKKKISKAKMGKSQPNEWMARKYLHTKEVAEKVSKALKGKPKSPEHKEKIRQAMLKKYAGML